MRGQIYLIDGLRFFTMGGASSTDKDYRVEGKNWWPEELPTKEKYQEALHNLDNEKWKVDIVLTHSAPDNILHNTNPLYEHDRLTNFLFTLNRLNT